MESGPPVLSFCPRAQFGSKGLTTVGLARERKSYWATTHPFMLLLPLLLPLRLPHARWLTIRLGFLAHIAGCRPMDDVPLSLAAF